MSKPPLSFKAQAVLDAVKNELDHAPWELSYLAGSSAAAALRAAAAQLTSAKAIGTLRFIAAELEGRHD